MKKYLVFILLFSGCLKKEDVKLTVRPPIDEVGHYCRVGEIKLKNGTSVPVSCETMMSATAGDATESLYFLPEVHSSTSSRVHCPNDGSSPQNCYLRIPGPPKVSTPMLTEDALIVAIEPGTYEANKGNNLSQMKKFYETLENPSNADFKKFVEPLQDTLRIFIANIVRSSLHQTMNEHGKKYGRIYFVMSDSPSKKLFLQTIDKATHLHKKVDLFVLGHGMPGRWSFNPEGKESPEGSLYGNELVSFAQGLGDARRAKVRHIFTTHCFSAAEFGFKSSTSFMPDPTKPVVSMSKAVSVAFPYSRSYGAVGVNTFPIHRDLVAFEKYYSTSDLDDGKNFELAIAFASRLSMYTAGGSSQRTSVFFPGIKGKGCSDTPFYSQCMTQVYPQTPTDVENARIPIDEAIIFQSYGFVYNGNNISANPLPITPVPKWAGISYFPKGSWKTYGITNVSDFKSYSYGYYNPFDTMFGPNFFDKVVEPIPGPISNKNGDLLSFLTLDPNQECAWQDKRIPANGTLRVESTDYVCDKGILSFNRVPAGEEDPCLNPGKTGMTTGLCGGE